MVAIPDAFKVNVARSFGRAALTYDGVAQLQRKIGRSLMEQLPPLPQDAVVLDLGAGTGFLRVNWTQRRTVGESLRWILQSRCLGRQ